MDVVLVILLEVLSRYFFKVLRSWMILDCGSNIVEVVVTEIKFCQSGLDCLVVCFKCCWWFDRP